MELAVGSATLGGVWTGRAVTQAQCGSSILMEEMEVIQQMRKRKKKKVHPLVLTQTSIVLPGLPMESVARTPTTCKCTARSPVDCVVEVVMIMGMVEVEM